MTIPSQNFALYYASVSGWNALLPPREPQQDLPRARNFASIVVGAGYTGLAAARRLAELEPDAEVLVIEASEVGEGASARNSGFLSASAVEPLAHGADTQDEAAARHIRLARAGLDMLRRLVAAHAIDCLWDETAPRFDAAATPQGLREIDARQKARERWGLAGRFVEEPELAKSIGTAYYRRAYSPEGTVFVQPAALIRGLSESLPQNVRLLERTAVTAMSGTGLVRVATTRGEFSSDRVLIAANAHARALGLLRDRMIAIYTYGGLTPELDQGELARLGELPQWGVIPAHRVGTTLRKFANRRFLVRSGDSYERELPVAEVRAMLTRLFRNRYPHMASHELEHVWGGATAITHNGGLYFGRPRPGIFVAAGCNGSGVVRGTINGHLLAEMALGGQSALLSDRLALKGPDWIPPEPFRRIGVSFSIAREQRQAGKEI